MFCVFKQKTAYEMRISDWSSDVCSSDLCLAVEAGIQRMLSARRLAHMQMDHGGARIGAGRRAEAELVGRKRQGGMIAFQLAGAVGGYRDNGCSHQPALPIAASTASPRRSTMIRSEEHTSELQSLMRISYAV